MRDNSKLWTNAASMFRHFGRAALNRKYVDNDLIPLYNGKLFYARDAFDGFTQWTKLQWAVSSSQLAVSKS